MKRLQWHLQQAVSALGTPGLIGVALLILAAMVQLSVVQSHRIQLTELKSSLVALHSQPQSADRFQGNDQQAKLSQFYAFFPLRSALSEQLRELHAVANSQQLDMGQVDYKLSPVSGTPLMRYQLSYTMLADYPSLRRYIAEILLKLPNAALENIELKRFSQEAEVPEAQMNIALYFRQGT